MRDRERRRTQNAKRVITINMAKKFLYVNHALHCLTLFVVFSFFCIVPYYFRKYSIVFKINTPRWDIELWGKLEELAIQVVRLTFTSGQSERSSFAVYIERKILISGPKLDQLNRLFKDACCQK